VATVGGLILDFTPSDPMKNLFRSAIIHGVIAVPIMVDGRAAAAAAAAGRAGRGSHGTAVVGMLVSLR
jgi:hypothetical protein